MLASLKIENVAVIESAAVEFGCGLNVITGETGAGKSIVIDAINAILGERTSRDLIRTGAEKASVYAVFEDVNRNVCDILEELGIENDSEALIISRTIGRDGKNSCRVNGCPVNVSMLRAIGTELIDIHGQHDSQKLLQPENHCGIIDGVAGLKPLVEEYRGRYVRLCEIRRELKSVNINESQKAQRIDMLNFQIDELEKADIRVGEREELLSRRTFINNAQTVMESLGAAYEALKGDGAGIDRISEASNELDRAGMYLAGANPAAEKLTDMRYELEDIAEELRSLMDSAEYDPVELEDIEERLDLLYRLSRKYGDTEEDMLAYLESAQKELKEIELSDVRVSRLEELEEKQLRLTEQLASRLTAARRSAGERLSKAICDELEFLGMPNVVFETRICETPLGENGRDGLEFLISANAGEEPKPLAKIASGGELSRIMLAIKSIIASEDDTGTMIFDEIDSGVSGAAAEKIALKLREVSEGRQVICVTHLAQIAVRGDVHFYISKSVRDGKTYTEISPLTGGDRVREIARINAGTEITTLQLENAAEMLRLSGNL
ncbi:MAG: DNA repair protein RecN [Clostridia bacterium]|nr:DNA repair protein RecN [Clostridia bacterium]